MRQRHAIQQSGFVIGLLLVGLVTLPATTTAQVVIEGTDDIDFDRPESWAMKYFASATLPGTFGAPEAPQAGEIDVALEYGQLPSLSREERRVGFEGIKVEDLNKAPFFVRPSVRVGLGRKLSLVAGYVPPIEANGVEANLLTLALARPVLEGERWRLGLTLRGQLGTIEGAFTCSEQTVAAGNDPARNPFGCEEVSRDEYDLETVGLEAAAAWQLGASDRWQPYVALSYDRMDLEFQVNARYSGLADRTRLVTDGETWGATAGLAYSLSERWGLAGEIHWRPLDVVRPPSRSTETDDLLHARAALRYDF